MQLIPAIDLLDGEVVRLRQGDFTRRTGYDQDPRDLAEAYAQEGANVLHVVDLNAARDDAGNNCEIVKRLAKIPALSVQCGGGIRRESDVLRLFDAGVARIVVGSLAVREPERVRAWLRLFGSERVVLALDVRLNEGGEPEVLSHGWRESSGVSLWSLLETYVRSDLQHVLCTDVSRDGMLSGPNIDLYREVLNRYPGLMLQASGGIGSVDDMHALQKAGLPAAILGRALLEGRVSLPDAQQAVA